MSHGNTMLRDPVRVGRFITHSAVVVVLAFALSNCATRPGSDVLAPVSAAPGIKSFPIYVATTRARATPSENVFNTERANTLNFARFDVAVPPNHQPGTIEWPSGMPDPRVSFATIDQAVLSDVEFRNAVAPARQSPGTKRRHNVLIFVHGYNNNFQESLYRLAQIKADTGFNGIPLLFAWPSQGQAVAYALDKEAAAYSLEYLIATLTMLTSSPQVGEILVVAHSMGGMLTAEALRELRVRHRDRVIARLNRVVLAAPDIDVEVFRSQVQTIGPLKPPLTVLVSKDDEALRLSSLGGGSTVRAGALDVNNPLVREAALRAKVRIVDISQLQSSGGGMGHDRFVNLAAFYPQLQRQSASERDGFGVFLFDTANAKPVQIDNVTRPY
jgi:esterase/lipase superfamily enzyme